VRRAIAVNGIAEENSVEDALMETQGRATIGQTFF